MSLTPSETGRQGTRCFKTNQLEIIDYMIGDFPDQINNRMGGEY